MWHGGAARKTYSVRLAQLGLRAADQALTRTLYAGQDAKVSVSGGFLHLSLPPKDAAVFDLKGAP